MNQIKQTLRDKVVVVTGASRGIGRAAALALSAHSAKLVLVARDQSGLDSVVEHIEQAGGNAISVAADVSDFEQIQGAVQQGHTHFGRIDVLVNNAGIIDPIAKIANVDPSAWAKVLQVNTLGVFNGIRAVLPLMLNSGAGTIINMSSGAANGPLEGWSHYCASKAAAKMLTQSVHKEYASEGITAVGLSPGTVATDMMRSIKISGVNPVSQLDWQSHIEADDVGKAIVYLCTDAAQKYAGTDFSIKTPEGRAAVGLH